MALEWNREEVLALIALTTIAAHAQVLSDIIF